MRASPPAAFASCCRCSAIAKRRKPIEDLHSRFKRLGRSLGRVRDADVRLALLASLETRMPHAAPALVVLRQQREQERLELLRKLVKRLERLEAVRLIEMLDEHRFSFAGALPWGFRAGPYMAPRPALHAARAGARHDRRRSNTPPACIFRSACMPLASPSRRCATRWRSRTRQVAPIEAPRSAS